MPSRPIEGMAKRGGGVTKSVLRQQLLRRLRTQPIAKRLIKSIAIRDALRRTTFYRRAKVIMCYVAVDGEVETRPILRQILRDGKKVAVPVTLTGKKKLVAALIQDVDRDLRVKGPFGIPQPPEDGRRVIPLKKLSLILVPGVAFDKKGERLGRGGGYFDRFLSLVPPKIPRLGLAFRFQVVGKIPSEEHDQPVLKVITD